MRRAQLSFVILMVAAGCRIGPEPIFPAAALHPAGAEVTLETEGGELTGELLALRAGAMVLRTANPVRLIVVSHSLVRAGSTEALGTFSSRSLRGTTLDRLRLTSRYPQGIDATLESALLREYDLPGMETLAE